MGTVSNIDPDKVYDYHTAFDIHPTQVVYNVDINANNKKILNIALDRNSNNSAATVGMVKEIHPFTTHNLYRKFFEEVFDFTDANIYGLSRGVSGVVFNSLDSITGNPIRNIAIPDRTIDDIREEGLDVTGYVISYSPPIGVSKYSLCIIFYHWRNRNFSLTKKNSNNNNILLKLNYDKTNNSINLTVSKTTQSFSMPSSFSGRKIVKISNYSSTLTIPAVRYTNSQEFEFTTEDGVLNKIMYSPNFYDSSDIMIPSVSLTLKFFSNSSRNIAPLFTRFASLIHFVQFVRFAHSFHSVLSFRSTRSQGSLSLLEKLEKNFKVSDAHVIIISLLYNKMK